MSRNLSLTNEEGIKNLEEMLAMRVLSKTPKKQR